MTTAEVAPKVKETKTKKKTEVRTKPDPKELEAITEYLKEAFEGCKIAFLYNSDNCYRFRANRWGTETIIDTYFIVATITKDKISHIVKSDKGISTNMTLV